MKQRLLPLIAATAFAAYAQAPQPRVQAALTLNGGGSPASGAIRESTAGSGFRSAASLTLGRIVVTHLFNQEAGSTKAESWSKGYGKVASVRAKLPHGFQSGFSEFKKPLKWYACLEEAYAFKQRFGRVGIEGVASYFQPLDHRNEPFVIPQVTISMPGQSVRFFANIDLAANKPYTFRLLGKRTFTEVEYQRQIWKNNNVALSAMVQYDHAPKGIDTPQGVHYVRGGVTVSLKRK